MPYTRVLDGRPPAWQGGAPACPFWSSILSLLVQTSWGLRTRWPDPQTDDPTAVTSVPLLSMSSNSEGSSFAVGNPAVRIAGSSSPAHALNSARGSGGGWVATHRQGPSQWTATASGSRGGGGGGAGGGGTRWHAVQDKACGTVTHMAPEAMVKGGLAKAGYGTQRRGP